jgi:hypothetical protein
MPKIGRPTTNPRPHKLSVRINDTCKDILENYCKENNITLTEAIERSIKTLKE